MAEKEYSADYIINFTKEWYEVVELLKKSKVDLSKIKIGIKNGGAKC